jgi:hypothetical protein
MTVGGELPPSPTSRKPHETLRKASSRPRKYSWVGGASENGAPERHVAEMEEFTQWDR